MSCVYWHRKWVKLILIKYTTVFYLIISPIKVFHGEKSIIKRFIPDKILMCVLIQWCKLLHLLNKILFSRLKLNYSYEYRKKQSDIHGTASTCLSFFLSISLYVCLLLHVLELIMWVYTFLGFGFSFSIKLNRELFNRSLICLSC